VLFAALSNGNRVYIDDVSRDMKCFCPVCAAELIQKRGEIRRPHFAHIAGNPCSDEWTHDMSEWHHEWQTRFPKETQEVVITVNGEMHRADILCGDVVVEFQNCPISMREFEERNSFYTQAGYRVIWVFNLVEAFESGRICPREESENKYEWRWHVKTFDQFDCSAKKVDVYFQFVDCRNDDLDDLIMVRVSWVSPNCGFRYFCGDPWINVQEFLSLITGEETASAQDEMVEQYDGKSILSLWQETRNIRIGRFVNLRTGYEVQVTKDPFHMSQKYRGRIYGRIKKPGFDYTKESYEIYSWNRSEWILRWYTV